MSELMDFIDRSHAAQDESLRGALLRILGAEAGAVTAALRAGKPDIALQIIESQPPAQLRLMLNLVTASAN